MQQRSPAFFALIALGVVLLLAGIVYGLGSRQVQYKSAAKGSIAHYLSADGTGYLQMEGNASLYIVHQDNFSPKLPTFADSDTVSFVYDPEETTAIDVKSTIGTHLVGTAAKVVAITLSDTAGQKTYTTPEYASNSQGYDHNQWPIGIGLLVVGLLLVGGSFFLPKKKRQVPPPPRVNIPSQAQQQQMPYQQNTPPYGQPIQQVSPMPYLPTQQNYPPQPGLLRQPSTPFKPLPQQPPNSFGQPQPNPFDQSQPANPFNQPQPPKPSSPGQFMRPKPFLPPQE
ncbi:MAG: hypothetical protein NVSMB54_12550 [Ktedonobacteraceae bacterium]